MTWDGPVAGSGVQIIAESRPYERIVIDMNPGETSESQTVFEMSRAAGGTLVVARYEADHGFSFSSRLLGLLVSRVFRRDFEEGLEAMGEIAENLPRADFSAIEIEHLIVKSMDVALLSALSAPDSETISKTMGDAYFEILNFIDSHGLAEAGAPLSIMRQFSGSNLQFDAAIPVRGLTDETPREDAGVRIGQTYSGPVIRVKHVGSYSKLRDTHQKIASYLAALGIERNGDSWESYLSDPTKVAEKDLITYLYYPIRQ